jgi:hypothetical protein
VHHCKQIAIYLSLLGMGCASTALRPPTPARDLSNVEMLAAHQASNDRYYLLVFGSETKPRIPRYTHTWATVVKVTQEPGCAQPSLEVHTISWMPASLIIHPYSTHVEPGTNLNLQQSIEEGLRHHEEIALWGPYETWYGLYHRFVTQQDYVESGALGYQCTDSIGEAARTGDGSNCFHALSDMDPVFDRTQYPLFFFGEAAARNIMRQIAIRPILVEPQQTHDWLIPALCLDHYPIVRRQYHGQFVEFSPEAILQATAHGSTPPRRLFLHRGSVDF